MREKKLITPLFFTIEEKIESFMMEQYPPGEFKKENHSEFFTAKGGEGAFQIRASYFGAIM